MAHKSKFRGTLSPSVPLSERINRARRDGRFQQALELTRQFHKQNPTDQSLALLREVSFERADQLQSQGHYQEAAQIFHNIIEMGGSAEFQRKLIGKLASSGAIAEAMRLVEKLGDAQLRTSVLGQVADHCIRQGSRSLLPAELQPQFDAILQAFAQAEVGKDEEARTTLQAIGLASPFMEWRILLRGLLAYYVNDDARALENWQRLDPHRLPARLASPLRFGLDPAFAAAQPPATQTILRQQLDRLQGAGVLPALRGIQALLAQKGKLAQAFRQIEGLLPSLRQQFPHLVPRLAACFRWAVIGIGEPEDIDRYMRVFRAPADDRQLHRLMALALEKNGLIIEAHERWQMFEKEVTDTNPAWPGELARRARALIWAHLGQLADSMASEPDGDMFLPFAPRRRRKERHKFKPSAEECYRKSLALAPESLATHQALLHSLMKESDKRPAFQAATKLLEHFPENVEALEILSNLCREEMRLEEAREYLQRALAVNPLERALRQELVQLDMMRARQFSRNKRFDDARAAYKAALAMFDSSIKYPVRCLAAIIELKAKNTQGYADLVAEAEKEAVHRLPVVYCLLCEIIRQKLAPAQKKPFNQEFQAGLGENIDPGAIPPLLGLLMLQRTSGEAPYVGQKTHEKKILALIEKAPLQAYPEEVLEGMCDILLSINAPKVLKRWIDPIGNRFPANPRFLLVKAELLMEGRSAYQVGGLLHKARTLIEALPRGDRQVHLLQRLQEAEQEFRERDGFFGFLNSMAGPIFGFDGDEDENDDYY